jgi:hypothetical protein
MTDNTISPPIREHGEGERGAGVVRDDGKSSMPHPATTKEQVAYLLGVKDGQRLPVPQDAIREAVEGIADDYMTSETHHPGYVLIPTAKFETILAALSAQPVKDAVRGALRECADKLWIARCDSRDETFRKAAERACNMATEALSPKSPASVGLDPETIERCAKVADAFASGQKQMADEEGSDDGLRAGEEIARFIARRIRALTPEDRP